MVNFELRQLSQFVAIAEAGSFRRAAQQVFIAQPALSVAIRKLEKSLDVLLFDRSARGVTLTAAGEAFLIEARLSLIHAEQARQSARLAALGEWGVVRLGFVGSASYRLLPAKLPVFLARYPGVRLELVEGTTVSIMDMLREGRLDVGVIRTPVDGSGDDLAIRNVEQDDLIAVLPRAHALAKRKRIDLALLHDEPFVMFSRTHVPGLRAVVVDVCRDAGFTPRVAQEVTQIQTLVGLVGSGLGVALLPGVAATFTSEQIRFVSLSNPAAHKRIMVSLATRREGVLLAAAKLCDCMVGEA